MKESMNLNNNVPINIRQSESSNKPLKSILKNNNITSLNPSNNSTQKKFFVNNLGAAHENFNVYERGSINSSETLPINTLNNLNSATNLNNIGSLRNTQPQQVISRRMVQHTGRNVQRVSRSPALKIVGETRNSYTNSARKSYNQVQQMPISNNIVYPQSQPQVISPRTIPRVVTGQFTTNYISSPNPALENSHESGFMSNYNSVQSNNHIHIQSLNQPSVEVEYNNYHPGTGYNSIPHQS
jgi:hypothetical protein